MNRCLQTYLKVSVPKKVNNLDLSDFLNGQVFSLTTGIVFACFINSMNKQF